MSDQSARIRELEKQLEAERSLQAIGAAKTLILPASWYGCPQPKVKALLDQMWQHDGPVEHSSNEAEWGTIR